MLGHRELAVPVTHAGGPGLEEVSLEPESEVLD